VLPLADLFMGAMLSRPQSGSLRGTWVTPATFLLSVLAAASAAIVLAVCAVAFARGGGWAPLAGILVCAALAAGSSAVALVGLAQRRPS
jgi:CHASE2 domain-containing sensor protein